MDEEDKRLGGFFITTHHAQHQEVQKVATLRTETPELGQVLHLRSYLVSSESMTDGTFQLLHLKLSSGTHFLHWECRYRAGSFACPDATRNGRSGTGRQPNTTGSGTPGSCSEQVLSIVPGVKPGTLLIAAPEAIVSMPARHNPSDTLQEAEAQEYALLEQQIRSEVGSLAWDIQPVLHLSQVRNPPFAGVYQRMYLHQTAKSIRCIAT